jgi:hypothetical protein
MTIIAIKQGDKLAARVNGLYRVGKILSVSKDGTYNFVPRFFKDSVESFMITEKDIIVRPEDLALVPNDFW